MSEPPARLGGDVARRPYRVSMRILHTSDWHIGRSFHGHATLDALRGVLETLAAQVRENDVDVVIVAGDVFDSAAPAAACYTLLTDTLRALSDAGAQIVVTSGNHDSAARLGFQSALLRDGIHVVTDPLSVGTPITIDDEHGPVHFYGIPFLEPAPRAAPLAGRRAALAARDDRARHGSRPRRPRRARRPVGRDRALLRGGRRGDARRRARDPQGSLDVVPLSAFEGPDYVALGHIHGRQQLSERVRYAGAPLHYSFGEADKPRGSWLVDLDAVGLASVAVARSSRPAAPEDAARLARRAARPTPASPSTKTRGSARSTPMRRPSSTRCAGCRRGSRSARP